MTDLTTIDNSQPGSIYVNSGGTLSVNNDFQTVTIQKPIVMAGGVFQTQVSGDDGNDGNAAIAASISLNSIGTFAPQASTMLTLNGAVSNGTASNGITLSGSGTLTLNGSNTYSGTTTIQAGTLKLTTTGNNNIANSPTIIVGDTAAHSSAILDVTAVSRRQWIHRPERPDPGGLWHGKRHDHFHVRRNWPRATTRSAR